MNIVDFDIANEIIRFPVTVNEKLLVDFIDNLNTEFEREKREIEDGYDASAKEFDKCDLDEAEQKGMDDANSAFSRERLELRELRRESKDVLKNRIEKLNDCHNREMKRIVLELEQKSDRSRALRNSLTKKTDVFYRDMNRLLSEIRMLKKKNNTVRIISVNKSVMIEDKEPDVSHIIKRWHLSRLDTEETKA